MGNVVVDLTIAPAKMKCAKCGKEEEIPPQKKLSDTMKIVTVFEEAHKDCV